MENKKFELPEVKGEHISVLSIFCAFCIIMFWLGLGHYNGGMKHIASEISAVQESSAHSAIMVAAILASPEEKRIETIQAACPAMPVEEKEVEDPTMVLCKSLMRIFGEQGAQGTLDAIEDVEDQKKQ